jgi:hypothetical protein
MLLLKETHARAQSMRTGRVWRLMLFVACLPTLNVALAEPAEAKSAASLSNSGRAISGAALVDRASVLPKAVLVTTNRQRAWALVEPHLTNLMPDTSPKEFRSGHNGALHWLGFGWPQEHDQRNCPWVVVFLDSQRRIIDEQEFLVHADHTGGFTPVTFITEGKNRVYFYFTTQSWGTGLSMANFRLVCGPKRDPKTGKWRGCREVFGGMRHGYTDAHVDASWQKLLFGSALKHIESDLRTLEVDLNYQVWSNPLVLRRWGRLRITGMQEPHAKPEQRETPWMNVNEVYQWDAAAEVFRPAY